MKQKLSFHHEKALAFVLAFSFFHEGIGQSNVNVQASIGTTNVEVNGGNILDIIDPYIKPVVQYTLGMQYEKALSRYFSVITGAQYSSRGFAAKEQFEIDLFGISLPVGASLETRLDYIEIPLVAKYSFSGNQITPYVKAGASGAYAFNGKITPKVNAIIDWTLPDININLDNDLYNRFDVSAIVGAGLSFPVGNSGAIQFEAIYRQSLNDMFQDNLTNIRIKSHGLSAGIGYSYRF